MRIYYHLSTGAALLLALTSMGKAQAARPLITDDATIVDHCQVETWWQRDSGESSLWLVPACNFANVEWALGGAKTTAGEKNEFALSAKTELRQLQPNDYGITVEVGHEFPAGSSLRGDTHLNMAFTKSWFDDQFLLHFNTGQVFREQAHNDWTSGVAAQWEVAQSQWLFAELYRETAGRPFFQLGYFVEVLPDRLQLDVSYGNRFHEKGSESFVSAGFVFYFSVR